MNIRDNYTSLNHLQKNELIGIDYLIRFCNRKTNVIILSPHGGGIEPGTTEIALSIASDKYSFYSFEGLKKRGNWKLHITSSKFDEPKAVELTKKSKITLAIHGCKGTNEIAYIGGKDEKLKVKIIDELTYEGIISKTPSRSNIEGLDDKNICNRNQRGKGVQIELTEGLRAKMFRKLDRKGKKYKTKYFYEFIQIIRRSILLYKNQLETI